MRKHRGSRKLDGYCLSRITAKKERGGKVSVQYIRTHTNHTPGIAEAKHIPLPQTVKREVRGKFGQSVKLESILDGMFYTCVVCIYINYIQESGVTYQVVTTERTFLLKHQGQAS
jgi:hypothetical protein